MDSGVPTARAPGRETAIGSSIRPSLCPAAFLVQKHHPRRASAERSLAPAIASVASTRVAAFSAISAASTAIWPVTPVRIALPAAAATTCSCTPQAAPAGTTASPAELETSPAGLPKPPATPSRQPAATRLVPAKPLAFPVECRMIPASSHGFPAARPGRFLLPERIPAQRIKNGTPRPGCRRAPRAKRQRPGALPNTDAPAKARAAFAGPTHEPGRADLRVGPDARQRVPTPSSRAPIAAFRGPWNLFMQPSHPPFACVSTLTPKTDPCLKP